MQVQQDYVLRVLEEQDIKFVRLWFVDVLGKLKTVSVSPYEIEKSFEEGIGFDGSSVESFSRMHESDLLAVPDAGTFKVLPWQDSMLAASMFCDIKTPDWTPSALDSRDVLRRVLDRAAKDGLTLYAKPEVEFYILRNEGQGYVPVDNAGYFDSVPGAGHHDFRRRSVSILEQMGIGVEFSHHEAGPGQYEIDLKYADPLVCADNIMTLRAVVKEVAIDFDCLATFMPKPFSEHPGSGMHTHLSIFEGDKNLFYDSYNRYQLSKTAQHFIAGVLRHASEISAVTNQFVNSYKRLWYGGEAPSIACWGHNNRSALVRVPLYKPNKASSCRIEYRALDTAANPYLAFALIIAAGMKGIEEAYPLPPESEDNVWDMSEMERRALGFPQLPRNLDMALDFFEESDLVAETLGEQLLSHILANKRKEWQSYRSHVSSWEWDSFLNLP